MIDYCLTENRFVLSNRSNRRIFKENLEDCIRIVSRFSFFFFYESDETCKSEESSVLLIVIGNFRTEVRGRTLVNFRREIVVHK